MGRQALFVRKVSRINALFACLHSPRENFSIHFLFACFFYFGACRRFSFRSSTFEFISRIFCGKYLPERSLLRSIIVGVSADFRVFFLKNNTENESIITRKSYSKFDMIKFCMKNGVLFHYETLFLINVCDELI